VYHDHEEGFVTDGQFTAGIGDVYGDPVAAAISTDGSWCAIAGAGVRLFCADPGHVIGQGVATRKLSFEQSRVTGSDVAAMWTLGDRKLGLVVGPSALRADFSTWFLDVDTLELELLR
jgi:hypothetical protein